MENVKKVTVAREILANIEVLAIKDELPELREEMPASREEMPESREETYKEEMHENREKITASREKSHTEVMPAISVQMVASGEENHTEEMFRDREEILEEVPTFIEKYEDDCIFLEDGFGNYFLVNKHKDQCLFSQQEERSHAVGAVKTLTIPPLVEGGEVSYLIVVNQSEQLKCAVKNECYDTDTVCNEIISEYNGNNTESNNNNNENNDINHDGINPENNGFNVINNEYNYVHTDTFNAYNIFDNIDDLNDYSSENNQIMFGYNSKASQYITDFVMEIQDDIKDYHVIDSEQGDKVYTELQTAKILGVPEFNSAVENIVHTESCNNTESAELSNKNDQLYFCGYCTYSNASKYLYEKHIKTEHGETKTQLYICDQCDFSVSKKYLYRQHISEQHRATKPDLYFCGHCCYSSKRRHWFEKHLRNEHQNKKFFCDQCSYSNSKRHLYQQHMRRVHRKSEPLYFCDVCDYNTSKKVYLDRHIRKWHSTDTVPKPFLYFCCQCGYSNRHKYLFNRHMKRRHIDTKIYKCKHCDKELKTLQSLISHSKIHSKHKCLHCDAVFKSPFDLNRHISYKHNKSSRYRCHLCDCTFAEKYKLKKHIERHDHPEEKSLKCDKCPFSTSRAYTLNRHQRTHIKENNHECHLCKKTFNHQSNLKTHIMRHTKVTKETFSCDKCTYKAARKDTLINHIQKMHGKPFTCNKCAEVFPDKYSHDIHRKIHRTISFKCGFCSFETKLQRILKAHMKIHTFVCDNCDKQFRLKSVLARHWDVAHNPVKKTLPYLECDECGEPSKNKRNLIRHLIQTHFMKVGTSTKINESIAAFARHNTKSSSKIQSVEYVDCGRTFGCKSVWEIGENTPKRRKVSTVLEDDIEEELTIKSLDKKVDQDDELLVPQIERDVLEHTETKNGIEIKLEKEGIKNEVIQLIE